MLRLIVRDRRVQLAALLAVLTVVLSRYTFSSSAAMSIVVKGGYWALLCIATYFGYTLFRIARELLARRKLVRSDVGVICLVLSVGGILMAHERYGFKMLADELLLLGTSMGMHYERDVAYPVRATDVQGPFQILQNNIDKRPFFYPFVVSLAHDFTGYRPENGFYVNTVLGFLFLGLVYLIGRRIGGSVWPGVLLVLLFGGLPLFAQQMKGGGFELLNLVMLATVLLLGIRLAERRDESSLEAFCYAAILLAYTRYESVLVLVPVAALIMWTWWRERRVILSWPVIVAPLLLVFALLQNRVFAVNQGAWELESRPGSTEPFALHYFPNNLGHALGFFFDTTGYQPNSPLFAAVGLLAAAFFLISIVRVMRAPLTSQPSHVATAAVGLGLFAVWGLLMIYFWGQFDHPVIHRLSLPVHLLMAIAIVAVGASLVRSVLVWKIACGVALAGMVVYSLPTMTRGAYAAEYTPSVEMAWRTEFLKRFPDRDYLFIDNDSVFWITHRVPASPALVAQNRLEGLAYHLRNHSFSAMYVMQHFKINPDTGERMLEPKDDIGPGFELEPLWERRIQTLFIGRISRIKAIRKDGKVVADAGLAVTIPGGPTRSEAEWDAARKAFVEKWLKQLP